MYRIIDNLPCISFVSYTTAEAALWRCHCITILSRRTNCVISMYRNRSRIVRAGAGVPSRIDVTFRIVVGNWPFERITFVFVALVIIPLGRRIIIDAFFIRRTTVVRCRPAGKRSWLILVSRECGHCGCLLGNYIYLLMLVSKRGGGGGSNRRSLAGRLRSESP